MKSIGQILVENTQLREENALLKQKVEELELEIANVQDAIRGCPWRETRCLL